MFFSPLLISFFLVIFFDLFLFEELGELDLISFVTDTKYYMISQYNCQIVILLFLLLFLRQNPAGLILREISEEDLGMYSCLIIDRNGQVKSRANTRLSFSRPPKINISEGKLSVTIIMIFVLMHYKTKTCRNCGE